MNRNVLIVIVLVVLVLLTAVQALQLNGLKKQISTGQVAVGAGQPSPVSSGVPSSIQDLPSMVGGC